MQFSVKCRLDYEVQVPSTLMFNIHVQRSRSQSIVNEQFSVHPPLAFEELDVAGTGNRFIRLKTGRAKRLSVSYDATVDCSLQLLPVGSLDELSVAELHRDTIPFLFPSRYCQSDKLGRLAWDLFGRIRHPYRRVLAIVDWIHDNVEYVRGSTTSDTSSYDTVTQRTGVCRDFAHLGIALCRALNIPARYFSGYAYQLEPADFHACFECHIGGAWFVFDGTRLAPLNGLVRVGTGRDAADAALASIFGSILLKEMSVACVLAPGQKFVPLTRSRIRANGVSLEMAGAA